MLNLLALVMAVVIVAGSHLVDGGSIQSLLNLPAALIVFGGSLAAAVLQSDSRKLMVAIEMLPRAFRSSDIPVDESINKLGRWARTARAKGFLALDPEAGKEQDLFIQKGLQMVVDGYNSETIKENLNIEIAAYEERHFSAAEVLESMGGYAPTLGILGAVLGLIQAMANIQQPELLGVGIATAFVATIYGVGSANLVFIPIAYRMKSLVKSRVQFMEMVISGLVGISNGENPRIVQQKLDGYRGALI